MLENLKAAIFEVFETMFFLLPELPAEVRPRFSGPAIKAWTPVAGPRSFDIGIIVPVELAHKMAVNFLGLGESRLESDKLADVLREAANMIAGSFLSREQVSKAYRLEPPRSAILNTEGQEWRPHDHHLLFWVDDQVLEAFLERTT